jgi:putative transposase
MKKRFTEGWIAYALRQSASGKTVPGIRRGMGVSEMAFYRWRWKYAGMGAAELRRLKMLEDENAKLKRLVADLSLDRPITICVIGQVT